MQLYQAQQRTGQQVPLGLQGMMGGQQQQQQQGAGGLGGKLLPISIDRLMKLRSAKLPTAEAGRLPEDQHSIRGGSREPDSSCAEGHSDDRSTILRSFVSTDSPFNLYNIYSPFDQNHILSQNDYASLESSCSPCNLLVSYAFDVLTNPRKSHNNTWSLIIPSCL